MLNPLTLLVTRFLVYVLPFEVTKQLQTNKLDKLVRERAIMQDISAFYYRLLPLYAKKKKKKRTLKSTNQNIATYVRKHSVLWVVHTHQT